MTIPATGFGALRVGTAVAKGASFGQRGVLIAVPYHYVITPSAIDDNGICLSQTASGASNLTIAGAKASGGVATLDVPRVVVITSAANDTGVTFTIEGTSDGTQLQAESILGGDSVASATGKAFKTVTRIGTSGSTTGAVIVGDGDTFGFPVRVDRRGQVDIYWNNTLITASTGFTAADTGTTLGANDVRGTYAVQSTAADSIKVLEMRIWMTDLETSDGAFGVDPYHS